MLDLKRFLRFEISGYVAILYAFIFCLAFYDLGKIRKLGLLTNIKLLDYSVTGFIIAGPIGFIMHQIDISIFSPFREKRLFSKREVISKVKTLLGERENKFIDKKYQTVIDFCLSKKGMEHIDNEISNRYSYYYARMEAGVFSPIFGFMIFLTFMFVHY